MNKYEKYILKEGKTPFRVDPDDIVQIKHFLEGLRWRRKEENRDRLAEKSGGYIKDLFGNFWNKEK